MENNDLDNSTPPRWVITLDVLTNDHGVPQKKWNVSWQQMAMSTPLDNLVKGALFRVNDRFPGIFEAVTFGQDPKFVEALFDRVEQEGWPLRYLIGYPDRATLVEVLKSRLDVTQVVDIPEYLLMWGARGTTMSDILGR